MYLSLPLLNKKLGTLNYYRGKNKTGSESQLFYKVPIYTEMGRVIMWHDVT